MHQHQWKGCERHSDRFQALLQVRDVVYQSNHRSHEEHAYCRQERRLSHVSEQLLKTDHKANRNRECEEGCDSPSSGTECFVTLLTSLPIIPPARILRMRGGVSAKT